MSIMCTVCKDAATHIFTFPRASLASRVWYVCDEDAKLPPREGEPYALSRLPDNYEGGPIDLRLMVRTRYCSRACSNRAWWERARENPETRALRYQRKLARDRRLREQK